MVPPSIARGMPFFLGRRNVLRHRDGGGPVDGHGRRDRAHIYAVEEHFHVGERVDGYAAPADLSARLRRVRVVPHQRRHVEGHGETHLPLAEQEMIAFVGLLRVPKPATDASSKDGRDSRWRGCRGCRGTRLDPGGRPRRLRPRAVDGTQGDVGDGSVHGAGARTAAPRAGGLDGGRRRSIIFAIGALVRRSGAAILP